MGAVFTWDEIQKKQVPELASFPVILKHLTHALKEENTVLAALVCGSVLRGDHTRRSDIDCVVIYETKNEMRAMSVMQKVSLFAKKSYVPINFIPCDSALAKSRMHMFGPSFMKHLVLSVAAGGAIKGNIANFLGYSLSTNLEIEAYIRAKLYNFEEAYAVIGSFGEERRINLIKKSLEAPMHIARKVLHYKGVAEVDEKKGVVLAYSESMPAKLTEPFKKLLANNMCYSEELEAELKNANYKKYNFLLNYLESEILSVIKFLRSNMILFDQKAVF